jgi:hypothetical protein
MAQRIGTRDIKVSYIGLFAPIPANEQIKATRRRQDNSFRHIRTFTTRQKEIMYDRRELPPNPPLAAAFTVGRGRGSVQSGALSGEIRTY